MKQDLIQKESADACKLTDHCDLVDHHFDFGKPEFLWLTSLQSRLKYGRKMERGEKLGGGGRRRGENFTRTLLEHTLLERLLCRLLAYKIDCTLSR